MPKGLDAAATFFGKKVPKKPLAVETGVSTEPYFVTFDDATIAVVRIDKRGTAYE